MGHTVLLYGATGYSGQLIAAEAAALSRTQAAAAGRMILAARDGAALHEVAQQHAMPMRVFGLDDARAAAAGLFGVDVVLNAAGPFAATAAPLVHAAFEAGCHYVDINGELDVYRRLDDLGRKAAARGIALVCGAGVSGAGSEALLDTVLNGLEREDAELAAARGLGAVRIAMSQLNDFSRGSAVTAARLLREQVLVIRAATGRDASGTVTRQMVYRHEPVGLLERRFDFAAMVAAPGAGPVGADLRIASAANLIDTLTALATLKRRDLFAAVIESYVQTGALGRLAYQAGAMLSPLAGLPGMGALLRAPLGLLPDGPTAQARDDQKHLILLEIEDAFGARLVTARLETPQVYQMTARLAVAIADRLARRKVAGVGDRGWLSPAAALGDPTLSGRAFRTCTLTTRDRHGKVLARNL